MRNKRFFQFALIYGGGCIGYMVFVLLLSIPMLVALLIFSLLSLISFYVFTQNRYHEIESLVDYLKSMNAGQYRFDIERYTEGELSILRSELYKTMVTLQTANDKLIDQRDFLNQSLADIAHQLRTPITSMILLIDLLDDPALNDQQRESFKKSLEGQIERYRWLVSALLTMSKLDAKMVSFHKTKVRDDVYLRQVIYNVKDIIEAKDVEIKLSASEKEIYIDPSWTKEAIINIIKNAIDYTEAKGRIEIHSDVNFFEWTLEIKDYGKGIEKEELTKIFERYYRGKNANKDSIGIGLAMTKMIVVKQGGSIQVESEVSKYTKFVIKMKQMDAGI